MNEEYTKQVLESIRQSFIQEFQDDDWHVTDVRPCTDEQYVEQGRYYEALGTYVVEMTAARDVDGLNKQGQYNKAPKDTKILYIVWHFSSGRVQMANIQVLPIKPIISHPLRIKESENRTPGYISRTGWVELFTQGEVQE
jgi:hypothetical protein